MANDIFSIASIGFDEQEQSVLQALFILTKTRLPRFVLFESRPDKKLADIVIVNIDAPNAAQRWNAYLNMHKDRAIISSVLVCNDPPSASPGDRARYLKKPLVATKLLSVLEEAVAADHGYTGQQAVSGEPSGENVIAAVATAEPDDGGSRNNISALVVDDSLPVRIQMKKALQNIAGRVDFAETGEAAEQLIRANKYDIVFLDVILPGVDGYEICKIIKKDPVKGNTPVIMLTSSSSPADRVKGKMAGCDTYLIKPVNKDIFKEVIHEFLGLD